MTVFRSDMEASVWRAAKGLTRIHWSDLLAFGVVRSTAKTFVARWEKAGLLTLIETDDSRKVYVHADMAGEAMAAVEPSYDDSAEGNMWRSMRGLREFSATDIAAHSNAGGVEVTVAKARAYCRLLVQSQHLTVRQSAIRGKREPRFKLVNNTGPVAPKPRSVKGVFDANTADFVSLDKEVLL
ncbi:hypothetical protein [Phaeobacter sp. HF9A]|uniref:hypothetical protein n=1 Tax=Phaeobacter sp. HF9A TaxID=2721561 RepID=UPI00142F62A6|nr:hypothetical protein [Phaeobacter sp. HF9A]NIZ13932.1 hypothetical protein [Phaeobacter sp. HF9A]